MTDRIIGRLAAWMTALVIVAISLLGYATTLAWEVANAGRRDALAASKRHDDANRRLDTALEMLRDAEDDAEELLEGQRTMAAQLHAAGIVPAIEVPPAPRRSITTTTTRPVPPPSSAPDRNTTTTTERPSPTSSPPRPVPLVPSTTTTSTTQPTTTTTSCLVLGLGCGLTGGPGR